ncbi:YifB family Mg chelatase-like AAA ATPase [Thiohalorhabdus sp.]|uniref:YifB family Mg chelatase-like AAA ATPase n=1 Tax=Thiohalorhabdus sp. TaxID=3094134 RepID=UPI002FC32B21
MAHAVIASRALAGVASPPVEVEVDLAAGLPTLAIVGLPETAVKEAKDRVRAALVNSGYEFPTARVTVNLAPADLPKDGGRYDLAIALGILVASGQLPREAVAGYEFLAELTLDGRLRPVTGALAAALEPAPERGGLVVAGDNAAEAAVADTIPVYGVDSLNAITAHLRGDEPVAPAAAGRPPDHHPPDLAEVQGQAPAKRALEVAAAGAHGLLMSGPPGAGKSLLARCFPGILPGLEPAHQIEVARIRSVQGEAVTALDPIPPFRAPHHSASQAALVGGGSPPRPGEITRAHRGVLFLDELPEFQRSVLEALREPLETGEIGIARAQGSTRFPARFQLLAAMNPCPCGYLGDPRHACRCTPAQIQRYRGRLSGPLLDRIDVQLEVPALPVEELRPGTPGDGEPSDVVRRRVEAVRARQLATMAAPAGNLSGQGVRAYCRPDDDGLAFLETASKRLGLSARAYHRILKLARTVADLAGDTTIGRGHIAEAVHYRRLDGQTNGGA